MNELRIDLKNIFEKYKSEFIKSRNEVSVFNDVRENWNLAFPISENHKKEVKLICNKFIKSEGIEYFTKVQTLYENQIKLFSEFLNNPLEV